MIVDINKVIVGDRIRKDSGDIEELAEDIRENGLFAPIAVNHDYALVDGLRRYKACRMLGWPAIDVYMVDADPRPGDSVIRMADNKLHVEAKWKTSSVRKLLSNPSDLKHEPCFICGGHEPITVLHHVVQVSELTKMLNSRMIRPEQASTPVVWLCPNCHKYVHESLRGNFDAVKKMASDDKWWACFRAVVDARVEHLKKLGSASQDGGDS